MVTLIISLISILVFLAMLISYRLFKRHPGIKLTYNVWSEYDFELGLTCVLSGVLGILLLISVVSTQIELNKNIRKFEMQREFIDSYHAENEIGIAGIVSTKAELNNWLFEQKSMGKWSVYFTYLDNSKIYELEPIK